MDRYLQHVDLYWFSGTGNTLRAAQVLAEKLTAGGSDVRLIPIERADPADVDPDRTLGIATVVAVFTTYPLVWDFLENLPEVNGTGAFLLDTLAARSGGMLGSTRRLLEAKGYTPLGAREIRMPSNYLQTSHNQDDDRAKLSAGLDEVRRFAADLQAGRARWKRWMGPLARLSYRISRWSKPWQHIRKSLGLHAVDDACTRCDLCVRLCPTGAISRADASVPTFSDACQGCMRCYSFCPTHAIRRADKPSDPYRAEGIKADAFLPDPANPSEDTP